mgnify:CR=1 FL=1
MFAFFDVLSGWVRGCVLSVSFGFLGFIVACGASAPEGKEGGAHYQNEFAQTDGGIRFSDGQGEHDTSQQPDTSDTPLPKQGTSFAVKAVKWVLPTTKFCATFRATHPEHWSTFDIDGDKKPDLVWTYEPSTKKAFASGGPHWKVFRNTGNGFSAQPVLWRVPTTAFSRTAQAWSSDVWTTFDINGDGKPDLVWTRDPKGKGAFTSGGTHWKVFKNTGNGFSTQSISWRVPALAFDRSAKAWGSDVWTTFDINEDGKPDLVWTRDPKGKGAFASGSPHWKVFKNTGSGFSIQPMNWRVPTLSFDRSAKAWGSDVWTTFDIDGDGKPDLVWTHDPKEKSAFTSGSPHWKVFKNTGSGFSLQPVVWRIPSKAFDRSAQARGSDVWTTFDINGDRKPDLVWTRDPKKESAFTEGGVHWKVFTNTGSGFSLQPFNWKVPIATFDRTAQSQYKKQWSTFDIDGDSKPDLVWTREPSVASCTSFASGGAHWLLFRNQ